MRADVLAGVRIVQMRTDRQIGKNSARDEQSRRDPGKLPGRIFRCLGQTLPGELDSVAHSLPLAQKLTTIPAEAFLTHVEGLFTIKCA